MKILVTGGAGFVGSNLACALAVREDVDTVIAFDSLKRRGSEVTLGRLRDAGVRFVHGDVRQPSDLAEAGPFDAMVECSAEPSVLAGVAGGRDFVVHTNLLGAYNCFEAAVRHGAHVVFLSTSRVYPVASLEELRFLEGHSRYQLVDEQPIAGASPDGISERFPLDGSRTLYGATKLCAEHLLAEYDIPWTVNRCGVLAGPWQMGRVDQGVFTHWALSFSFGRPLRYIGYGGSGKQVRDLLHIEDFVDLIALQLADRHHWSGCTQNVGGGRAGSLSLLETTALCRELSDNDVPVTAAHEDRPGDLRIYLSDCALLYSRTDWRPRREPRHILADIFTWIRANETTIKRALT